MLGIFKFGLIVFLICTGPIGWFIAYIILMKD